MSRCLPTTAKLFQDESLATGNHLCRISPMLNVDMFDADRFYKWHHMTNALVYKY